MTAFNLKQLFKYISVDFRNWHKATIQRNGTFRESGAAIHLQDVVNNGCNEVVNEMQ